MAPICIQEVNPATSRRQDSARFDLIQIIKTINDPDVEAAVHLEEVKEENCCPIS